eukprot:PhM_4_TR18847/c3_g1_i4/m.100372
MPATVHEGRYCISLDFMAWFDQFELAPEERRFHCFLYEDAWYRLKRLPMGQRQAVDVAHTATELLLSFPRCAASVSSMGYVDNVRFLSDDADDVVAAATQFVLRCRHHQRGRCLRR